jgi:hypothetical protein
MAGIRSVDAKDAKGRKGRKEKLNGGGKSHRLKSPDGTADKNVFESLVARLKSARETCRN